LKQLIEEIFQKSYRFEYKTLIGFFYDLRNISKFLGIDSLYKSKEKQRERRPAIVELDGKNSYKVMFLSTKNYSRIKVDIKRFCVVNEDEDCTKLNNNISYVFNYKNTLVFSLPKEVLNNKFFKCGGCKKHIKEFIELISGW